jgi:hypothetical protein
MKFNSSRKNVSWSMVFVFLKVSCYSCFACWYIRTLCSQFMYLLGSENRDHCHLGKNKLSEFHVIQQKQHAVKVPISLQATSSF